MRTGSKLLHLARSPISQLPDTQICVVAGRSGALGSWYLWKNVKRKGTINRNPQLKRRTVKAFLPLNQNPGPGLIRDTRNSGKAYGAGAWDCSLLRVRECWGVKLRYGFKTVGCGEGGGGALMVSWHNGRTYSFRWDVGLIFVPGCSVQGAGWLRQRRLIEGGWWG